MHWWQIDLGGYVIWMLERLHLVHDVYRVPAAQLTRYASRTAGVVPVAAEAGAEMK